MIILDIPKSNRLRERYISTFVNIQSKMFIDSVQTRFRFSDGLCYTGYLWDCLKKPVVVSEAELAQELITKKDIYIMWDIHSQDRIFVPNYWKYPKECILYAKNWSEVVRKELPEDIYVFDESFAWSAIYTHETDLKNAPYCLFLQSD